ncbi:class II fructose-bisphosphate aldolase [Collinsella sp. zg1085]|uniref:class II fructose-bisphosphate aldolase n=1 Tax=Collinsella sp. zg1085 TaxID=2844380 RepID=UPI001C0AF48F|nr:class II fructose-bisphosphate aldolase [Collinsella sp. zg1085]QWT17941.1 class II fructose-bisphosphate aldolase [Collinsella sp. zg1085]
MYVSMKEMLLHASEHRYAVMAINCVNLEQAKAICYAADAEAAPVIINISPRQMKAHATPEVMVPLIRALAEPLDVPVALNLDHGAEFKDITRCIRAGYSSVMVDASQYDFEENIRRTRLVTALAHERGISVEAELGHVGQAAAGDGQEADFYTRVDKAVEFVERTHCDALAVAIGTAHGSYPDNYVPQLDFDRLAQLKEALNMPLVLHGGSGAGEANIRKAVALGINKINVCTDLFRHQRAAMHKQLNTEPTIDYMDIQMHGMQAACAFIRSYMHMIGSSGRYQFRHTGDAYD